MMNAGTRCAVSLEFTYSVDGEVRHLLEKPRTGEMCGVSSVHDNHCHFRRRALLAGIRCMVLKEYRK